MTDTALVAVLSLAGTLAGSFGGILAANRLVNYRLQQLEKQVSKHNSLVERTYALEGRMNEMEHELRDMKEGRA